MKTIILIPSRLASTRLPNKPLKNIAGLPMIVRVMECAKKANMGEVCVATPDKEIDIVVKEAGGNSILTQYNHESGTDRVMESLNIIDPDRKFEKIINLQGDIPLMPPDYIKIAAGLLSDEKVDIGTLITPLDKDRIQNFNKVKVAIGLKKNNLTGKAIYFSRAPVPANKGDYYEHIGIYAYKRNVLERFCRNSQTVLEKREKLEQLRALELGMNIHVSIVDKSPIGVDTYEDLETVRKKFL
ncbi:MAG: 3-deoxy-manno-octulosonate cytidylyltransferase [Alphaproteobacteria bacterium MarineAlpha2_Bin1]|nr:MAG: 3-deoxy-manno-octulosonate cytidylyltransferase [Alphaproteobacteria bacterium MarineAlpha2_Bin1]|tara:strand:- start:727 stop:1452 length:726 start_codon:yes stop_codon:yes gene_type:complete